MHQYFPMIYSLADYYSKHSGHDREELVAIGNMSYAEALNTHQPELGSLSTHTFIQAKGAMLNEINSKTRHQRYTQDIFPMHLPTHNPATQLSSMLVSEIMENEDCAYICSRVLGHIWDLGFERCWHGRERKFMIRCLTRLLRQRGWSTPRVRKAYKLIHNKLKEV